MSKFTSTTPAASAVNDDGSINVSLISKEITDTTREANTYTAVDSMKKKAIHTATSYEEFRNFVHCAELKPLKAGEFDELGQKKSSWVMRQTFDPAGVGGGSKSGVRSDRRDEWEKEREKEVAAGLVEGEGKKRKGITKRAPKDGNDFDKAWRKVTTLSKGDKVVLAAKRKEYLTKFVTPTLVPKLFKTEMDVNIMGHLIDLFCVRSDVTVNDDGDDSSQSEIDYYSAAYAWLEAMSKCGRFSLNVKFLDDKQNMKVREVLESGRESASDTESYDKLRLAFSM